MDKEGLIYSAHYDNTIDHSEVNPPTSGEAEKRQTEINEIIRRVNEESVYFLVPERLERANKLKEIAIAFSKANEIDIEIYEKLGSMSVWLYYDIGLYKGDDTKLLGALCFVSDDVEMFNLKEPRNRHDHVMIFTVYTHHHFVSGKEITMFD